MPKLKMKDFISKSKVGEFILDCMKANERVGQVAWCPNCHCAVTISQVGDEEQVTCDWCGLVAIDGSIVVPGKIER